jgi:hypothetical protein
MEDVDRRWRKSSFSGNGGECVEVGRGHDVVVVRDTVDRSGAMLRFAPAAWRRFADRVRRLLALDPGCARSGSCLEGALSCLGAPPPVLPVEFLAGRACVAVSARRGGFLPCRGPRGRRVACGARSAPLGEGKGRRDAGNGEPELWVS